MLVFLKWNQLFDAGRPPEGTLGGPKRRLEDQRGPRSKKKTSWSRKVLLSLRIFMFFFRKHRITPVKNKARTTLENRMCKNWEGRNVELPLYITGQTRLLRDTRCFRLFWRHRVTPLKYIWKSTLERAMFKNPLCFKHFEIDKMKLEDQKLWF